MTLRFNSTSRRAECPPPPPRINWRQVIVDLQSFGLSCRAIGGRVGRGKVWVLRLRNGTRPQPRFTDGCRLLRLWADATGNDVTQAPKKASV